MNDYHTLKDIMNITGYSERTIRRYLKSGKLNGIKIGKEWRFTEDNIKALLDSEDFASQISSLSNEKVKLFLQGNYKKSGGKIHMCTVLDFEDLTKSELMKINVAMMKISKKHNGIDMKLDTKNKHTRISLIGGLDYVSECIDAIKKIVKKD
jgi:excisionase family DNA binding protein